jgi:hypothetical protein
MFYEVCCLSNNKDYVSQVLFTVRPIRKKTLLISLHFTSLHWLLVSMESENLSPSQQWWSSRVAHIWISAAIWRLREVTYDDNSWLCEVTLENGYRKLDCRVSHESSQVRDQCCSPIRNLRSRSCCSGQLLPRDVGLGTDANECDVPLISSLLLNISTMHTFHNKRRSITSSMKTIVKGFNSSSSFPINWS